MYNKNISVFFSLRQLCEWNTAVCFGTKKFKGLHSSDNFNFCHFSLKIKLSNNFVILNNCQYTAGKWANKEKQNP